MPQQRMQHQTGLPGPRPTVLISGIWHTNGPNTNKNQGDLQPLEPTQPFIVSWNAKFALSDAKMVAGKVNIDEIWVTLSKWGAYSALAHEHRHTHVNI